MTQKLLYHLQVS